MIEALQKDCNIWAPGIEIISVRVTKPHIPESLMSNYEKMETEKTNLLIANENQKVVEKIAETKRMSASIAAETEKDVSEIKMQQEILQKKTDQNISAIEDKIYLSKQKAITDAEFYKQKKQIEANQEKLTDKYIRYESLKSIEPNQKYFFGDSIPSFISQNSKIEHIQDSSKNLTN